MELTNEQIKIIDDVKKYDSLKIIAFAGTGKTTTLYEITKSLKYKKFLYLAFNKSIVDEAKSKFDNNVNIKTIHSLAYQHTIGDLKFDIKKIKNNYRILDICKIINNDNYVYGDLVFKIFNIYCDSSFDKLTDQTFVQLIKNNVEIKSSLNLHVGSMFKNLNNTFDFNVLDIKKRLVSNIVKDINLLFNKMENLSIDITHSFYFKYFQINLNKYIDKINYDYVLLDEAQDSNDATLDIFKKLKGKKVMVGDPHQNIYGFRGSSNIMDKFDSEIVNYLSTSFRFHSSISILANKIIKGLKTEKEDVKTLKSGEKVLENRYVLSNLLLKKDNGEFDLSNEIKEQKTNCVITRTNGKLISVFNDYLKLGKKPLFIRNPEEIFSLTLSLYYFKKYLNNKSNYLKDSIKDKWLFNFETLEDVLDYAETTQDLNLKTSINLVDSNLDLEFLYNTAKDFYKNKDTLEFDLYLTNAHTSKGLEWDNVIIEDDFITFNRLLYLHGINTIEELKDRINNKDVNVQPLIEELNLFYVAITRAKRDLTINNENNIYISSNNGFKILENDIALEFNKKMNKKEKELGIDNKNYNKFKIK